MQAPEQFAKHAVDASAAVVGGLTWLDQMPNIAALFSVLWLGGRFVIWVRKLWKERQ